MSDVALLASVIRMTEPPRARRQPLREWMRALRERRYVRRAQRESVGSSPTRARRSSPA